MMPALLRIVLATGLTLSLACKKDETKSEAKPALGADKNDNDDKADKNDKADNNNDKANNDKADKADNDKVLAPSAVDPERPIPVGTLAAELAVLARGSTFKIVGYPSFFLGDKRAAGTSIDLAAEPGVKNDKAVIKCRFAEASKTVVSNTELVEVTAVLDGAAILEGKRYLRMSKCAIVGKADTYPKDAPVTARGTTAVAAGTLTDFYYGWMKTEVAVVGDFWGVTTSKNPKTNAIMDIRVDIKDALGKKGGCHLEAEPPKLEGDARKGVVFRGTFNGFIGKHIQLEPCKLANR